MADYLINFVNDLDPNGGSLLSWPKYSTSTQELLTFIDGLIPLVLTKDTFRQDGTSFLTQLSLANPI